MRWRRAKVDYYGARKMPYRSELPRIRLDPCDKLGDLSACLARAHHRFLPPWTMFDRGVEPAVCLTGRNTISP